MIKNEFEEFPVLETERLILRAINLADCHALLEVFSSEEVMKWYGMYPLAEMESVIQIIESFRTSFAEKKSIRWAIELKVTGDVMGTCGFHNHNQTARRAEIGYELNERYWGRGYIKEAIKAMMDFGGETLNLRRIEALVYPENKASHSALESLGFKEEGLLRDYAYFRNVYQDLIMYSWINENHIRND